MLKATFGGVPVEVWFTPSFNIKTTDKQIEMLLRNAELESFDPWKMKLRKVKATRSLHDAFLVLEEYRVRVPELKVTFEEAPEIPSQYDGGTKENPVVH